MIIVKRIMENKPNRKKTFYELSEVAKFHLAPKLFGENAKYPFLDEEINEIRLNIMENALKASEGREKISTSEGKHMKEIIEIVLKTELNKEAEKNAGEKLKLELAKEGIKKYTNIVMESLKVYIGTILSLEEMGKNGNKEAIAKADDRRKVSHNALIDNINILNRSLLWWFGKFNPNNLTDAQMRMYEKQEEKFITYNIERIEIPPTGICSPSYSIENREEITRWAKAIYKDLISVQKLSGTIN